jgi:hypothetical protein
MPAARKIPWCVENRPEIGGACGDFSRAGCGKGSSWSPGGTLRTPG